MRVFLLLAVATAVFALGAELDLSAFHTPSFLMVDVREGERAVYSGPAQCRNTTRLTQPSAVFRDGSGSGDYRHNLQLCWEVRPPTNGQRVKLTFPSVEVETGFDFVRVYDLANNALMEDEVPDGGTAAFYSNVGFLVNFVTDDSVSGAGFEAQYSVEVPNVITPEEVVVVRNHEANHKAANTQGYKSDGSVITRRGVAFTLQIDPASVVPTKWRFNLLKTPKAADVALSIEVDCKGGNNKDITCTANQNRYSFTFSKDAPIGAWDVDAILPNGKIAGDDLTVYLLFNPFLSTEETFNPKPEFALEYLRPTGSVFAAGNARPWNFGVGDMKVLKGSMHALRFLTNDERRRPFRVAREISWKANDEVLHGRWDGKYQDGKEPGYWSKSVDIIGTWYDTNTRVKYGQCWVFSAITNSMSRSVGIPTRSVTNMGSAHEAPPFDNSCKNFWVKQGTEWVADKSKSDSSIWNFHVWNEGWFGRPDLNDPAPQWNGFDGTCQEMSDGRCQMGPARIKAVMEASQQKKLTTEKFDAAFLSSETNCDKINVLGYPQADGKIKWEEQPRDTCSVGINTWTLRPGTDTGRDDVAPFYKNDAHCRSPRFSTGAAYSPSPATQTTVELGAPISIGLAIKLGAKYAGATGEVTIRVEGVDQPGTTVLVKDVFVARLPVTLDATGSATIPQQSVPTATGKVKSALPTTKQFSVTWSASIKDSNWVQASSVTVVPKPLKVTVGAGPKVVGGRTSVSVQWRNPLPESLPCKLSIGFGKQRNTKDLPVTVAASAPVQQSIPLKLSDHGKVKGTVTLACAIGSASGVFEITVRPRPSSPIRRLYRSSQSGLKKIGPQRPEKPGRVGAGYNRGRRRRVGSSGAQQQVGAVRAGKRRVRSNIATVRGGRAAQSTSASAAAQPAGNVRVPDGVRVHSWMLRNN